MIKYIIYRVLNKINGKFYIGRTKKTAQGRWSVHKAHSKYCEKYSTRTRKFRLCYFHSAIRKYGAENFEIKQIDETDNFQKILWLEKFYIRYYDSSNSKYGYNSTSAAAYGDGVDFFSKEHRVLKANQTHSKFRRPGGVTWDKSRGKWQMNFKFLDIDISKRFEDESEAKITKDKLSLLFFKENAQLYFPENRETYLLENLSEFYETLVKNKKKTTSKYKWVKCDKNGYFMARVQISANKRLYIGVYKNEDEAALNCDKLCYFLKKPLQHFNFPLLINESYEEDGKRLFEIYSNPHKQVQKHNGKTSKFNGVSRRSANTWEMNFSIKKQRIRLTFKKEEDAAKKFDECVVKFGGNKNKLNFLTISI